MFNALTNSTPNLVAWMAEYKRYLSMVAVGNKEEAAALKLEIQDGLSWVGLSWDDLEFAVSQQNSNF